MTRPILILTIGIVALLLCPVAAAQSTPTETPVGYYDGESSSVDLAGWLAGLVDATLDDIVSLALRVGLYIIGGGVVAQGGVGSAGALLTGLLVAGTLGSVGVRAGAGTAGGLTIALMAAFLFLAAGVGATWAYPVVLFIVGLIVATVFLRLVR